MGFGVAISSCFSKYVTFSGRASRSEYWWFVLFLFLGQIALGAVDVMMFGAGAQGVGPLGGLFGLVVFLPGLSAIVRRLHDIGRSGWWYWILMIPLVGFVASIAFLVVMLLRGTPGPNRYGPDPKDPSNAQVFS